MNKLEHVDTDLPGLKPLELLQLNSGLFIDNPANLADEEFE